MGQKRFVVNPLGECIKGHDVLCGSINLREVFDGHLTEEEQLSYLSGEDSPALHAKAEKLCQEAFDTDARENLKPEEYEITKKIWDFQSLNTDRFRVYGGIKSTGKPWIVLTTEFIAFSDNKDFWQKIHSLKKDVNAKVFVMSEEEHLDSYSPPQHTEGEVIDTEKEPTEFGPWAHGPNHGRMEKQIEFSWDILSLSKDEVKDKIKHLATLTKDIWKTGGVSVL